ncbi:MAG TPA: hypothetical protein VFZ21_21760 [Gemmatimonadaceae bacterium]|jgi:hypothetical protein|nr:hypothetical protein [Gemmatimonadaceae bacterium]
MRRLPDSDQALVLRTDFSDQAAWDAVRATLLEPVGPYRFYASVAFVDDPEYRDVSTEELLQIARRSAYRTFLIVADRLTMTHREHPLLIVDLNREPGREFRALPSQIQSIENNLSLANMDFAEFADAADADGVFRGFDRY